MAETTFKFEELSSKAKEHAIASFHEDMSVEYDMQTEYLVEYVREHFDSADLEVQWSLHSQGSGVNIAGKIWHCDLINKPEIVEGMTEKEIARLTYYTDYGANYIVIPSNSHYTYCKVDDLYIAHDIVDHLEDDGFSNIDYELVERYEEAVKAYINDLCNKLYGMTLDWEEETWTYGYMQDVCHANDYEFDEDGNLI